MWQDSSSASDASRRRLTIELCVCLAPGCFEVGVDYTGSDLERIEGSLIDSPEDCQAVCQQSKDCFYFTWVAGSKNCYLKGLFAPLGRRQDATTTGVVSGARFCNDNDIRDSACGSLPKRNSLPR